MDEPPTWKPGLIPPTAYIAGVDHLPSKFWPVRQRKGPRPPLPPTPKPNFFTLGRMGEHPRLCPVNHDRTDILRWGS